MKYVRVVTFLFNVNKFFMILLGTLKNINLKDGWLSYFFGLQLTYKKSLSDRDIKTENVFYKRHTETSRTIKEKFPVSEKS